MGGGRPRASFTCPNCQALYEVVKVEAGPETTLREVTCLSCGGPLLAREGKFVLKYFMLREASRSQNCGAGALLGTNEKPVKKCWGLVIDGQGEVCRWCFPPMISQVKSQKYLVDRI